MLELRHSAVAAVFGFLVLTLSTSAVAQTEGAKEEQGGTDDALSEISLDYLLETQVVSASRTKESLLDVPATVVVVSREEIEERGYTNLAEVVQDLPGFDISLVNGTTYMLAYQRGYRTPWTQRTLLMIDGNVDNHLWSHQAEISRQYPLSNIERIEVLYGPAAAVYGPNAFLGVINIITRDPSQLEDNKTLTAEADFIGGSWTTRGIDATAMGRYDDFSFSLTARLFRSDEADLSGEWGWLTNEQYSDEKHWGPIIPHGEPSDDDYNRGIQNAGVDQGQYYDPTDDYGVMAKAKYKGLELGYIDWRRREAYGPYYAAEHVQNNAFWTLSSRQIYAEHTADLSDDLKLESLILYRESDIDGNWTEATPDWREGRSEYSFVSHTDWHSDNDSFLIKERLEYQIIDEILLSSGIKYERKDLTKAYDIPGYWSGSFSSSTDPSTQTGPEGSGQGIYHSSRDNYQSPPETAEEMPAENRVLTEDIGGFVQGTFDVNFFRLNAGVRYDRNSIYGDVVNPRMVAIMKYRDLAFIDAGAVKLLYGTAFQEPAPVQLYGGWQGRAANPDLQPETVENYELNTLLQAGPVWLDLSGYYALYRDVITETALNTGRRRVFGGEAKVRLNLPNPIKNSDRVKAFANYTYTQSRSSRVWDFETGQWNEVDGTWPILGDIAPHKLNLGITYPALDLLNVSLHANWVSKRKLYLANALRNPNRSDGGRDLDGYLKLDGFVSVHGGPATLGLKVNNILGTDYLHPGAEGASSGDDFDAERAGGFQNSLVPTPGRSYFVTLNLDI